jgi:hypothetical protein
MLIPLYAVLALYTLMACFIVVMHAKFVVETGRPLSWFWKAFIYPLALLGLWLDIAFNLTVGTIMFLELPRELTFTSRCKRHKLGQIVVIKTPPSQAEFGVEFGWRYDLANWWCKQLNQIDLNGHC